MSVVRNFLRSLDAEQLEISVDAATGLDANAGLFIDIREESELEDGVIAGARILARGRLELDFESLDLPPGRRAVIYCASGVRSALAVASLRRIGFDSAFSLAGGIAAWKESGGAIRPFRRLKQDEKARYARQMRLPQIGETGQMKLRDARVAIVGAGGLGSPAALYLAAAGIGTIDIIDHDIVELSNLHRQVLHRSTSIGRPKVESAAETLFALNPAIAIVPHQTRLDPSNAAALLATADVVVDGSDNLATRSLLNEVCLGLRKPIVYGAVEEFCGQVTVFGHADGPCYRCVYPEDAPKALTPNCAEAGVIGALPGIIGVLQAAEAIKLILGIGTPLSGRIVTIDVADGLPRSFRVNRRLNCKSCGPLRAGETASDAAPPTRATSKRDFARVDTATP